MFTSVSVFFLALSLRTVKSDDPVYGAVGNEVVLKPGPVQGPITSIMWKHGQDIAMEQYQGSVEAFRQFKERGSLNVTTGVLTITGLTPGDSGSYTAEINNKVTSTTQLLVISRVSKPTVSTQCDADNTYCVFTCERNDTTAEPVTYSWMAEEKSWTSTKEIRITNDESEKQFHCELSNPVSTELSEPVDNPFRTWNMYNTVLIICSTLLIGGLIGLIVFILYKSNKRKGKWYTRVLIICPVLLILGLICLICLIFFILNKRKKRKGKWYYTVLIICSTVFVGGLIFLIFFTLIIRNRIKGKWYNRVLITCPEPLTGGLLIFLICLILFILYIRNRIKEWGVTTQSLVNSLSSICYRRVDDNQAPRSEPPGGSNSGPATNGPSETRPENVVSEVEVSMNHVPTPTASLENSEEGEAVMGSSRDPESDVTSETSRKDGETVVIPRVQDSSVHEQTADVQNQT